MASAGAYNADWIEVLGTDEAVGRIRTSLGARDYELIAEGFSCGGAHIAAVLQRGDEVVAIVRSTGVPVPDDQRALSRALMAFLTARGISEVYPRFDVVWQESDRATSIRDAFPFDPR